MIIKYVILDGNIPREVGQSHKLPNGAIEVEESPYYYLDKMIEDGMWKMRPIIPEPDVVGSAISFSGLPNESCVVIHDIEAGIDLATLPASDGIISFELVDSAEYMIRVDLPLPWMPWERKFVC